MATDPDDFEDEAVLAQEDEVKPQRKWPVLLELWRRKRDEESWVVTGADIVAAIGKAESDLGTRNTANFLKDIVRRKGASALWPPELIRERISARQVFGKKRVFEFVRFPEGVDEAFPDRFGPLDTTPIYDIQSVSLPFFARRLGRNEESWLSQVVVNLKLVEAHLAFASAGETAIRDLVHLQTGMKTQPEIDATFIATYAGADGVEKHILLTCEAKREKERLLEEQLRFQVRAGMNATFAFNNPPVEGVKPMGIQLVDWQTERGLERLIYIVEFRTIERKVYETACFSGRKKVTQSSKPDDEAVFGLELEAVSRGLYRLRPSVAGISFG
ncbi:MAG: hypothetical protein ACREEY_05010 [Brevundimonas sp.]